MREKNVVIFLNSTQSYEGMDPDATEVVSQGTLQTLRNGEYVVTYQESELTGMEGTTTRFRVRGGTVILERSGAISSQMIFQEGRPCSSLYETPWGTAAVDIATSFLKNRLGERGGSLEMRYAISVEGRHMGETHIRMRVRERGKELPI